MDIRRLINDDPHVYIYKDDFYVSICDKYSKIVQHKIYIIIYLQLNV